MLACEIVNEFIILDHLAHLGFKLSELVRAADCEKVREGDVFLT